MTRVKEIGRHWLSGGVVDEDEVKLMTKRKHPIEILKELP